MVYPITIPNTLMSRGRRWSLRAPSPSPFLMTESGELATSSGQSLQNELRQKTVKVSLRIIFYLIYGHHLRYGGELESESESGDGLKTSSICFPIPDGGGNSYRWSGWHSRNGCTNTFYWQDNYRDEENSGWP